MSNANLTVIDHRHWFVGDTHFGHTGILDMAARPYPGIKAHDRDLVRKWNDLVQPRDTVWHLGDVAGDDVPFDEVATNFKRLHGIKRLIVGNHDGEEVRTKLDWASVDDIRTLVARDCKVVLCHYPLMEWEGYFSGDLHFHGHTHDRIPSTRRRWDCGVDHQSFLPMTFSQITKRMAMLQDV
ncbi:metallophosphoesterase [Devosia chinhatensis]|uniref:Calcineurin-like phosphoesterase domain-containing protein n=1 Tax=Devosia chinhatensis TaxID=429727 RepID=A0A0F5FJ41_9HYPH|nr:metallophosphoesterase [Devosia chinhatensis]KKB08818.1 hypothetical protein VE26_01750 [Devosia chinhatensis]